MSGDMSTTVRLGDGSEAFRPDVLESDLLEVSELYQRLDAHSPAWDDPGRDGGWSSRQTIAHLDVMASMCLRAVDDALAGRPTPVEGIEHRRGLDAWNDRSVRSRIEVGDDPAASFVRALRASASRVAAMTSDELLATSDLPIYNAPITVADLFGVQAFHPGLTHAAQAVEQLGLPPLWADLAPATRHRMITRLARALGYLYWPERGGPDGLTIAIEVGGPGGGSWCVVGTADGAEGGEGHPARPDLTLRFADTAAACRMFTRRLPLLRSIVTGQLRIRGDLRIMRRFGEIFSSDG